MFHLPEEEAAQAWAAQVAVVADMSHPLREIEVVAMGEEDTKVALDLTETETRDLPQLTVDGAIESKI